jgi:lipoyl(octanoyl) transferase
MNKNIFFQDLGNLDYKKSWDYQEELFQEIVKIKISNKHNDFQEVTKNHFLFVEHPHVYTLGKSGDIGNLLLSENQLVQKGINYYKINRGGDITYHGPGQLVVYPIFDLDHFFSDIHKYLRYLEEAVIQTLAVYGIIGERFEGLTGVWIEPNTPRERKICAMGVKCSRWVTMHGIGFNINSDLSYFNNIIPCGIENKSVTSMQEELGFKLDFQEVSNVLKNQLAKQFEFNYANH